MFSFLFVSLFVLCYNTMLGNGQCTTSSCKDSITGSEEHLLKSFEEHDHKVTIMHQNLSSAIGKLREDVNRSILRVQGDQEQKMKMAFLNLSSKVENMEEKFRVSDQRLAKDLKEHDQNLKSIYHNMSLNFESICRRIGENQCCKVEEKEQNQSIDHSCISNFERTVESIQSVNESFMRTLERNDREVRSAHQNFSSRLEKNEETLAAVEEAVNLAVKKEEENGQKLETLQQNLSSTISESIQTVNENLIKTLERHDRDVRSVHRNFSSRLEKNEVAVNLLVKKAEENEQTLETIHQNLSSKASRIRESIHFVNESIVKKLMEHDLNTRSGYRNLSSKLEQSDEKFQLINEHLSSKLQLITESVAIALEENERKFQTILEKMNEKLSKVLDQVNESLLYIKSQDYCRGNPIVCDCSTIRANGFTTSGVYRIYVVLQNERHYANAFCDMTTENRSWTVFQRRKDGSEEFYRRWKDYANGFGNPNGEFWLGNEFLHLLTSKRRYRLRIDLEDFEGETRYAEYSGFSVQSSDNNYTLTIGNYAGNAGDSMSYHNNQQFSTFDHGNVCAARFHGAWWYNNCHASNLNGRYLNGNHSSYADGINWYHWRGHYYSLKTTELKIAPLN